MWVNNLNPTLFHVGPFEVRYYGLVYAIGFLLVYYFLYKKREELKMNEDQVTNLVFWLIIGLVVGARVFAFNPIDIIRNPLEFFKVWQGGMSFFGGFLGSFLVAYFFARKHKLSLLAISDAVMIPAAIALILGRLANFVNGELPGTVTGVVWCVVFPAYDSLCRHPYPIYASLSHAVLLGIVIFVGKIKKEKHLADGVILYSFMITYGALRLITDFFRDEPRLLGLIVWQYMAIALLIAGIYLIKRMKNKSEETT